MSWDAYISDNLMVPLDQEGTTLTSAAIVGHDGGVWAKSAEFPFISDRDTEQILAAMTDSSITYVSIDGVKYWKLSVIGDNLLRCRKDKVGFIARKTRTAIVVGFYTDPPVSCQASNKIVDEAGYYLEANGC
ncbi:Profilin-2 [Tetrabaena socialis]|uniref:Profilin n=1 Tax=Tetrabaena socialis TaxID=47790 RepID=A0A2J8AKH0_9CHLO|nr:Profilin-2 [Tetrabaena socialis]|eukprot:PNH13013.1 Profilin-2 [Tetrabaena socialis]